MKAEEFWFANDEWFGVTGTGVIPEGEFTSEGKEDSPIEKIPKQLRMILVASALCNNSSVQRNEESDEWESIGDPTEVALQVAAQKVELDKDTLTEKLHWEFQKEAGFDSERKRMTVIYKVPGNQEGFENVSGVALTKGALETLLKISTTVHCGDEERPIDEEIKKKIQEKSASMASKGI
jgi:magnesium-transporting ATPase (P-type)